MKINLSSRRLIAFAICSSALWAAGCAALDYATGDRSRTPFVVEYSLAPGASNKDGVQALTNTGARIFASAELNPVNSGLSSFGGTVSFPRWVRMTWREGVTTGKYWTTGTVVADHTIDVQSRIPSSFFEAAKEIPRSAIKLQFRIKDDKVLFAWCVQKELSNSFVDVLNDGDFKPAKRYNGVVIDPGWEK